MALDTSDANDMTNTMLTDLRTIGSAICEFMLTLPNPCGLNELVEACKDLWKGSFDYRTLVITLLMCTTLHAILFTMHVCMRASVYTCIFSARFAWV